MDETKQSELDVPKGALNEPTAPFKFKAGDTFQGDSKIEFIYGQSPDVIVFEATGGGIKWGIRPDQLSHPQTAALGAFDRLHSKITELPSKSKRIQFLEYLASVFFSALCEETLERAIASFEEINEQFDEESKKEARFGYFRGAISI